MNLSDAPTPREGFLVTHFLTVEDQVKSREFYAGILGGKVVAPENPCIIRNKQVKPAIALAIDADGNSSLKFNPGRRSRNGEWNSI
jgi:hypothetical protein